jgi:hypothetical protein
MALEHGVKKGKLSEGGDEIPKDGVLTPLYEEGEKGGNPESPAPEELAVKLGPPDPMGFLKHLGEGGGKEK